MEGRRIDSKGTHTPTHTDTRCLSLSNTLPETNTSQSTLLQANAERDMALARHVSYVHRNLKNPEHGDQAVRRLSFMYMFICLWYMYL